DCPILGSTVTCDRRDGSLSGEGSAARIVAKKDANGRQSDESPRDDSAGLSADGAKAASMSRRASPRSRRRRSESFSRHRSSSRFAAGGVEGGSAFQSGLSWRIAAMQSETDSPSKARRP